MSSSRPGSPGKKVMCFARIDKHLPGWFEGETYIHPTVNCEIKNSDCSQYIVFRNDSELDYDVSVELISESRMVQYLEVETDQKSPRWSDTIRVLGGAENYTRAPLCVIREGDGQIVTLIQVTVKPINGFGRYLPAYEKEAVTTSIRVNCKSPL